MNPKVKLKKGRGFTLIELLVVIAIIGLLASVVLVALQSARQKSRDTKRLGDMAQMNTALELYFSSYKGYPSATNGLPGGMVPEFLSSLPQAPQPPDGSCGSLSFPPPVPAGTLANTYYYISSGTASVINGITVYPGYAYYFCLGGKTGNFDPGVHYITDVGIR